MFIGSDEKLKPTVAALALYPAVHSALNGIRSAIAGKETFDPARERGSFKVAIPHVIGPFVALRLEERLKAEAPLIELTFDTRTLPTDLLSALEEGRTDVAVDWWSTNETRFSHQHVFDDRLMLVVRREHPRIREAPSLESLTQERFVGLHRRPGQWERPAAVVKALAVSDWKITFEVSEFLELPMIVASTDLLSMMPMSMAAQLEATGFVRLLPIPITLPPVKVNIIWHFGRTPDPAHMWLRQMVRQEVGQFAEQAFAALQK